MVRRERIPTDADRVLPLGPAEDAEDDVFDLLARAKEETALEGLGGDLDEGTAFGDVAESSHAYIRRKNPRMSCNPAPGLSLRGGFWPISTFLGASGLSPLGLSRPLAPWPVEPGGGGEAPHGSCARMLRSTFNRPAAEGCRRRKRPWQWICPATPALLSAYDHRSKLHPWGHCHGFWRHSGHGPLESVPEAYVRHSIAQLLSARTVASTHSGGHFQACEYHRRATETL